MDKPIETINTDKKVKCFTFFADSNKLWRNIKFNLDYLEIQIQPSLKWIPVHLIDEYYFAMHSPNIIPDFKKGINYIPIKRSVEATMLYYKMSVNIEHELDCHHIDHDDELSSDCLAICLMKRYKIEIGHKYKKDHHYFYVSYNREISLRKGFVDQVENFDPNMKKKNLTYQEITENCKLQCKPACQTSYFVYDIKYIHILSKNQFETLTRINIHHDHLPDIYIRHLPEMTIISFISNFGGLLGIWLGISVFLIFENCYSISKYLLDYFFKLKSRKLVFIPLHFNYINNNYINYHNHN